MGNFMEDFKKAPVRQTLRVATDIGAAMLTINIASAFAPSGLLKRTLYSFGVTGLAYEAMRHAEKNMLRFYDAVVDEINKKYNDHNETENINKTEVMENVDETNNQGETSI